LRVYDIAIIGAGPAGIAAAVEAYAMGITNIILIEKAGNHSTTIRNFYKDGKRVDKEWQGQKLESNGSITFLDGTKESTLDFFDELLSSHKIESFFNEEAEKVEKKDGIFDITTSASNYHAKAVILAVGKMGKPNKPSCQISAEAKKRVHYNLDKCSENETVLVVGGGNSAAEYAVDLSEKNDSALSYRKPNFTRLNAINLLNLERLSSHGKIRMFMGTNITAIDEKDGKAKVSFEEMEPELFDRVIFAIGGSTPIDFLKKCGVELEDGEPILSDEFETKIGGMFISGDIAFKNGGSIVVALDMSYKIVKKIQERLGR
jgi:thioredoxin reductase (NADPH)